MQDENKENCFNLLHIKLKTKNGRYEVYVHQKPPLTNLKIKHHSCIRSNTITSVFKEFLAKATKICSEIYLSVEIENLTMFCKKVDMIDKHYKT